MKQKLLGRGTGILLLLLGLWSLPYSETLFRSFREGVEHPPLVDYRYALGLVVGAVGILVLVHGFARPVAIAVRVFGGDPDTSVQDLEEDISILRFFSRIVLGVGRVAMLIGMVAISKAIMGYHHFGIGDILWMTVTPLLFAVGLSSLAVEPACELLRSRIAATTPDYPTGMSG